ncbi:hypothetical protein I79_010644 [Cricetulus griseus]|uniref:Uncharacterized protein n=1 Tax=Cricetulus griseus TaxID=10029 RepID=G3HJ10_CRIGR|nr:hypothetical protein I79_010644 [Cricetulus griseus]
MAQWIKVIAAKPGELSLIPRTHIGGGGNQLHKLSSDFHSSTIADLLPYIMC